MKYRVEFYQDNLYRVMESCHKDSYTYNGDVYEYEEGEDPAFTGSLSDCEAYIRLHKEGYM